MSIYLLVNQVEAVMVSFITTFCLHVWHARKHMQTNTKIFCGCAMIVKVHWEKNTFVPAVVSLFPFENLFWLVSLISKLFIWCPLMFLFDNRTVDFRPTKKRNNSQQNCTSQSFKKKKLFLFCHASVLDSASTTACAASPNSNVDFWKMKSSQSKYTWECPQAFFGAFLLFSVLLFLFLNQIFQIQSAGLLLCPKWPIMNKGMKATALNKYH